VTEGARLFSFSHAQEEEEEEEEEDSTFLSNVGTYTV